eukprot:TRINITY_DN13107_c0_g1_i2.p1 TRINITY_DN13107_c0_g1~~TRINITY_DN13107_c0_g1_i2.p1  ORF type:complete len:767 (+),score=122.22 TRINITY_DN13107_c0_g1_i2:71-2371(+)
MSSHVKQIWAIVGFIMCLGAEGLSTATQTLTLTVPTETGTLTYTVPTATESGSATVSLTVPTATVTDSASVSSSVSLTMPTDTATLPTPSETLTMSPSKTKSLTGTVTATASRSVSLTHVSESVSLSVSITPSNSISPSPTSSLSKTASLSLSPTVSWTIPTPTASYSQTPSLSRTSTVSLSRTSTMSLSLSRSVLTTPTPSLSWTLSPSATVSLTIPTRTLSLSASLSATRSSTVEVTIVVHRSKRVLMTFDTTIDTFNIASVVAKIRTALIVDSNVDVVVYNIREGSVLVDLAFETSSNSKARVDQLADTLVQSGNDPSSALRNAEPTLQSTQFVGETSGGGDDGLSEGEIAAIIVSAILIVVVILITVWLLCFRKSHRGDGREPAPAERAGSPAEMYASDNGFPEIKAALEREYGSVEIAAENAYIEAGTTHDRIQVDGVKTILETAGVGDRCNHLLAALVIVDGEVQKSDLIKTLGGNAVQRGSDENAHLELLRGVFTRAGGGLGVVQTSQLTIALKQDPMVLWTSTPQGDRHWGQPVMTDIANRPHSSEISWDEFRTMCLAALNAAHDTKPNANPLRNVVLTEETALEFEEGDTVEALYHGSWFDAVVLERKRASEDLPSGGYVVMWVEDESRTLVRREEVRARETAPSRPASSAQAPLPEFSADEPVTVFWNDGWYSGKIAGPPTSRGTYTVQWPDETVTDDVETTAIRHLTTPIEITCGSCKASIEGQPDTIATCPKCQEAASFVPADLQTPPQIDLQR